MARDCDFVGRYTLVVFFFINFAIVYLCYRHLADRRTAWCRIVALSMGLPMLFAMERGNLIIPCFTCFALGYGRVLRSARLRWIAVAFTINFKPYLLASLLPQILRGRWRWIEGAVMATIIVYLISFIFKGVGTPWEIASNILIFAKPPTVFAFTSAQYASSYVATLALIKSDFPLMFFLGSRPIELMTSIFPLVIHLGELGVVACFAATLWAPRAISATRLSALGTALALTATNPGGYTEVFLLFFLFQERWRGPAMITALVAGYVLCIPWDFPLIPISREIQTSYILNRTVGYDVGVSAGELARPALLLVIEYGLVAASLADVAREMWRRLRPLETGLRGAEAIG